MLRSKRPGERYLRLPLKAEVVVLRRGDLWESRVVDISATGMLMDRPAEWDGSLGDALGLELIVPDGATIALLGVVVRYDGETVGIEFTRIPPESEIPLWKLLGICAESTEDAVDVEATDDC